MWESVFAFQGLFFAAALVQRCLRETLDHPPPHVPTRPGISGSARLATSTAPGEGTALRAVSSSGLGQDAFGALQAANQSLKTFKARGWAWWR